MWNGRSCKERCRARVVAVSGESLPVAARRVATVTNAGKGHLNQAGATARPAEVVRVLLMEGRPLGAAHRDVNVDVWQLQAGESLLDSHLSQVRAWSGA